MAVRVVTNDNASGAGSLANELAALSNGDTLRFQYGGPYTVKDFENPTDGITWIFENASATTQIALPMNGSSGTCIHMNRTGCKLGTGNGKGFRVYRASGTGGVCLDVGSGSTGYSSITCYIYDSLVDGAFANQGGLAQYAYTWNSTLYVSNAAFTGYNLSNPGIYITRAGASTGVNTFVGDYLDLYSGLLVHVNDSGNCNFTLTRSNVRNAATGIYITGVGGGGSVNLRHNKLYGITAGYGVRDLNTNNTAYSLNMYRNTFDSSTRCFTFAAAKNTRYRVRGNWFSSMQVPAAPTAWTNNGYAALAAGSPDVTDFLTDADPGFVNKAGADYSLLETSVLIDAGWDAGDSTDAAGNPAVVGAGPDCGAYEFQCVPPSFGDTTLSAICSGLPGHATLAWDTGSMTGIYDLFGIYSGSTQLGTVGITTGSYAVSDTIGSTITYTLKARSGCDNTTYVDGPTASFAYDSVAEWGGSEALVFTRLSLTELNVYWPTGSIVGSAVGYNIYVDDVLLAELDDVDTYDVTAEFLSTHEYMISLIDECGYEVDGPSGSYFYDWLIPASSGCFDINPSNHNIQEAHCSNNDYVKNVKQIPMQLSLPAISTRKSVPYRAKI